MASGPPRGEIARITDGRDITRGWVDGEWWQRPQDRVLLERGQSDHLLYEDLLRDDKVFSTFQQRRAAVVARETQVIPGGKAPLDKMAAEHLDEILAELPWDEITNQMLYATIYGWSVAEVMWGRDGRYVVPERILPRDRRRFVWRAEKDGANQMRWQLLLRTVSRTVGEPVPMRKFWTATTGADHADEPYGRGLGHQLYWPVWFKRNQVAFWLVALEKFGMPTGVGKHPPNASDDDRKKLLEAVKAIHSDSGVVIPDTTVIELLQRVGGEMNYDSFYGRMNDAITQVVLSETMTSEDGSSRSQAEIHMEVRQEVVDADAWLIHDSLRHQVARWLVDWNFPGAAVPIVRRVQEQDPDLNQQAARDKLIMEFGGRYLAEQYIVETYGVTLGDEKMQAQVPPGGAPGGDSRAQDDDADADMAGWQNRPLSRDLAAARPRPDEIEQVLAAVDDGAWDQLAENLIRPVLDLAQNDPAGMIRDLAAVYPQLETRALTERLARLLFAADALGRLEVAEEQEDARDA